jgi:hypothetical protein
MERNIINPNEQLDKLLRNYLPNRKTVGGNYPEFEGRFGTRGAKINKIEYDNVMKVLLSRGFAPNPSGNIDRLSIMTQFRSNEGVRESAIRVEIHTAQLIQEYCRNNKLDSDTVARNKFNIQFIKKTSINDENGVRLDDADFADFNFSVSYKNEMKQKLNHENVTKIIDDWPNLQKKFRLISRVQFKHEDDVRILVDMSVVRTSTVKMVNGRVEPLYFHNISDSNVFNNEEGYEIEFELRNQMISEGDTPSKLIRLIHQTSKTILCGIQNTNFPIAYSEKMSVIADYSELIGLDKKWKIRSTNFIGPSSVTLQRRNVIQSQDIKDPNICRGAYTVTDKADGERHLLFIAKTGKIYLINTSMDVISTGSHTTNENHFLTLIDGELIKNDKNGKFINKFAAFDMYFYKGKDTRHHPFISSSPSSLTRMNILTSFVDALIQTPNIGVGSSYVSIQVKTFLFSQNMLMDCRTILNESAGFEYNVDGLIFTHREYGVGSNRQGVAGPLRSVTWAHSFKWKPSEYNTNDFLISTKKDSMNNDIVTPYFNGNSTVFYKTLVLKCGYRERDNGYLNPVADVIDNKREKEELTEESANVYKPEQFIPTEPANNSAGLCYIPVKADGTIMQMMTSENDIIEDNTIVEFRFDKEKYDAGEMVQKCWIPIRNRYDKTAKYRRGEKMFGNAYQTANSNWFSIHCSLTREMICGLAPIPDVDVSSDVYYNNSSKKSNTNGLRNFHNIFVKRMLIDSVSRKGDTLIDYGCGKGGDFPKWIKRELSFVLGIDYSKDNIENRTDGAYARYITHSTRHFKMPKALFVNGDCSKNIRNGDAVESGLNKEIVSAVFGQGDKSQYTTHSGIFDAHGLGENGFNVSSCQFAIHYFFKNATTLHNFLRNVSECTALNGYFIGTCYDGHSIMHELRQYRYDEGKSVFHNQNLICKITKRYETEDFEKNESCLGKEILVYQDSINQSLPEYLVNFKYLSDMLEMYGFEEVRQSECRQLNLPRSEANGMFSTLYDAMMRNSRSEVECADAINMTDAERYVSFLNMYFVFKKVRQVNAESVANSFIQGAVEVPQIEEEVADVEEVAIVKQLHSTIVLKQAPVEEEKEKEESSKEVKQISNKSKKKPIKIHQPEPSSSDSSSSDSETSSSSSSSSSDSETTSSEPIRKFKASPVKPQVIVVPPPVQLIVEEKPKRKYTKKAVAVVAQEVVPEVKPKRAYTKKAAPVALEEVKPKRKYTKKGNEV